MKKKEIPGDRESILVTFISIYNVFLSGTENWKKQIFKIKYLQKYNYSSYKPSGCSGNFLKVAILLPPRVLARQKIRSKLNFKEKLSFFFSKVFCLCANIRLYFSMNISLCLISPCFQFLLKKYLPRSFHVFFYLMIFFWPEHFPFAL